MTATEVQVHQGIDREAVLRTLNLNPNDPRTQALILICERYLLDPVLKHVVLIDGRPYITRDGYLTIAHRSEQLDGIEVLDEGEDDHHWWARVAVYRRDMTRPFAYKGRYPKVIKTRSGGNASNVQYGPEMAIKTAEVAALRRAFNVTGAGAADERWDDDAHHEPAVAQVVPEWLPGLQDRVRALPSDLKGKLGDYGERVGIGRGWGGATEEGRERLTSHVEAAERKAHQEATSGAETAQQRPAALVAVGGLQEDVEAAQEAFPHADAATGEILCDAPDCQSPAITIDNPWCAEHEPFDG